MATLDEFSASRTRSALAIFCRAPRWGTVKTRLAQTQGAEYALGLYTAMLRDSFSLGRALAPAVETFACFTSPDAFVGEESLKSLWDGPILAQCEGDLGEKMLDCFEQLRARGYKRIVLMGSDSPDLPLVRLEEAFGRLQSLPMLLGESFDGGFYLLGASIPMPEGIFEGIVWSSSQVTTQLKSNLKNLAPEIVLQNFPRWRDVDDEGDLEELKHRLFKVGTYAPCTRAFLMEQGDAE